MSALSPVAFGSIRGDYRPSATLRPAFEELSKAHSIEWTYYDEDGLGRAACSVFQALNSERFGLVTYFQAPIPAVSILTLYNSPLEAETIDLVLCQLELTSQDLLAIRGEITFSKFDLIRQDDHGHQFCAGTYTCRADAMAAQRKLEAAVHKQEYWLLPHVAN